MPVIINELETIVEPRGQAPAASAPAAQRKGLTPGDVHKAMRKLNERRLRIRAD
jgi:hypothetical protein